MSGLKSSSMMVYVRLILSKREDTVMMRVQKSLYTGRAVDVGAPKGGAPILIKKPRCLHGPRDS
jgi:hypothetical protein